jgi:molecular chaperone DnaJ
MTDKMGPKDYYKILGVGETASEDEIKKQYRKLAKQYHPDTHPGDKAAEEKFKDISEAYNVLSHPDKRSQYDQMRKFGFRGGAQGFDFRNFDFGGFGGRGFGTRRGGGSPFEGFDFFGGLGDLFSQFFDMGGGFQQRSRRPPREEKNVKVELSVPWDTAVRGGKASFSLEKEKVCPVCEGGGAKPGSRVETCPQCGGRGYVSIGQGGFGVNRPCPGCSATGRIIHNPCDRCSGTGIIRARSTYSVKIPAGTRTGDTIRLKGQGKPGARGQKSGDMLITVRVQEHHFFRRKGNDITCIVPLTLAQAAKGSVLRVGTVQGKKAQLKVPPMTRDGTAFRLRGLGATRNGNIGDQYVTISIKIPSDPNEQEREWIKKLIK